MTRKKLCIDAAHGGEDAGTEANGYIEKDLTLEIALLLKESLDLDDRFEVFMTRETDETMFDMTKNMTANLLDRIKIAEDNNVDLFMSIAFNTALPTASGIEADLKKDEGITGKFAHEFIKEMRNVYGAIPSSIVEMERGGSLIITESKCPAVIIKPAYITNLNDIRRCANNKADIAKIIYESLLETFDLPSLKETFKVEDSVVKEDKKESDKESYVVVGSTQSTQPAETVKDTEPLKEKDKADKLESPVSASVSLDLKSSEDEVHNYSDTLVFMQPLVLTEDAHKDVKYTLVDDTKRDSFTVVVPKNDAEALAMLDVVLQYLKGAKK